MSTFTKTYWLSFLVPFTLLLVLFVLPFIFTTVLPSENYVVYQITNILSAIVGWLLFNILVYVFNWLLYKFIIQYVQFGFWCYCVVAYALVLNIVAFLIDSKFKNKAPEE